MTIALPQRARRVRAGTRRLRRTASRETRYALVLGALLVFLTVMVVQVPTQFPFTSLTIPVVVGSIVLGPRTLPWFVLLFLAMVGVALANQAELTNRTWGAAVVQLVIGLVVLAASVRRLRLGVAGLRGESMFVDLRDRILNQSGIPTLPDGWHVESALESAGGTAFAGDFVVASRSIDGRLVQIVVVDVSGKGVEAGTRALLLSGAFGGILGSMPAGWFLTAANNYLLRQGWDEGFATAVHLTFDVRTGAYEVRSAGHPPAAHRIAGTGRWEALRTEGPLLGLVEDAEFTTVKGVLAPGDAIMLYTDGMVETRDRDIDLGFDRLCGEAEAFVRTSFRGAAAGLARALGSKHDDRALVVVHRD